MVRKSEFRGPFLQEINNWCYFFAIIYKSCKVHVMNIWRNTSWPNSSGNSSELTGWRTHLSELLQFNPSTKWVKKTNSIRMHSITTQIPTDKIQNRRQHSFLNGLYVLLLVHVHALFCRLTQILLQKCIHKLGYLQGH